MFQKDKNVRRLSEQEITQFENDGYLTGLPVFDKLAKPDLDKFFVLSGFLLAITLTK